MIARNPMQLKAFIKKKATEKGISAQLVMQNYMLERLLERISLSKYRRNFIIKAVSLSPRSSAWIRGRRWIWTPQLKV